MDGRIHALSKYRIELTPQIALVLIYPCSVCFCSRQLKHSFRDFWLLPRLIPVQWIFHAVSERGPLFMNIAICR